MLEWYRGEDAGDLKRSELVERLNILMDVKSFGELGNVKRGE